MAKTFPTENAEALAASDLAKFAQLATNSYFMSSRQDALKSRVHLFEVSVELERLDSELHSIHERKKILNAIKEGLHSHISLVSRLPVEVLQRIFASAVEWSGFTNAWFTDSPWWKGHEFDPYQQPEFVPHGSRFGDMCQSPWNVSQVCKRWRDIALKTPQLWSYIEIDLDWSIWDNRSPTSINWLLELAHNRALPHGINLLTTGDGSQSCDNTRQLIYPLLVQHAQQWQRVFSLDSDNAYFPEAGPIPDELPLLKNVALACDIFPHGTKLPSLASWYSLGGCATAPHFTNWCTRYSSTISGIRCRMADKTIDLLSPSLSKIATMHRLRVLRITLNIDGSPQIPPFQFQLPAVNDLSLDSNCFYPWFAGYTLPLFSAPALRTLHLSSLGLPSPLVHFIIHSGCSLTSLRIDAACLDSSGLSEVIRLVPSLEALHVAFIPGGGIPSWWKVRQHGVIRDVLLEQLFDPDKTLVTLLRRISLRNVKELDVDFMLKILDRRLKRKDDTPLLLKHVQVTLPGYETAAKHEKSLQKFRCAYRLFVEIKPWQLPDEGYSVATTLDTQEAQFTSGSSESGESDLGSDSGDESGSVDGITVHPAFDWLGHYGLLDPDGDPSDYEESSDEGDEDGGDGDGDGDGNRES